MVGLSVKCNVVVFQSYLAINLVREASHIVITKCPVIYITVKTFELLQPYFSHLSCMPAVYVTQGMLPMRI